MEEMFLGNYLKENYKIYDRFTFDQVFRFLLSNDFEHEEAKDIIMNNCALSALVLQERIHNEYYYRISVNEEISEDLNEFISEIAEKIINLDGKECKQFYDFLENRTNNTQDDLKKYQESNITNKSFSYINDCIYNVKHGANRRKIQTIYGQLESILNIKIYPAPDEWDRTYCVDFYINVNEKYIGLQIKPISSGRSLNQYQWIEMHRANHEKFMNDFGSKVFFIYSIKSTGKKKKIFNIEIIEEIKTEIERLKG
jgi:hypothetical protein